MNISDVDLVIEAAEKYGFNLEFKTKNLFQMKGYSTQLNKLYHYEGEPLELDVQAELDDRVYLVECKGTAANSRLILIKDPNGSESTYSRRIIDEHNSRLMGFGGAGLFCTFTGDFFNKEQSQLKKLSKNDTENNFYKAQIQLSNAICAVSSAIQTNSQIRTPINLMPLIVTNAQIWVIDYEQSPTSATQHKWVKHKVISNTKITLSYKDSQVFTYIANVVNINHLKEFIDLSFTMNRSNGTIDSLNNTAISQEEGK